MKPWIRQTVVATAVSVLALFGTAQADPISELPFFDGEIGFVGVNYPGFVGATPVGGTSLGTATGIEFNSANITVAFATGDFLGVPAGTAATFNNIVFNPSTPINPLWVINTVVDSVNVVYSLSVHQFVVVKQNDQFLSIWGDGYLSATGYQDTSAQWTFTYTRAGDLVSVWGSTTAVPEPGILALFGFGLLGLGISRRQRKLA